MEQNDNKPIPYKRPAPPPDNELRIRYVNQEMMRKLHNIAHRQGVSTTSLVKLHLKDILDKYPVDFQKAEPKD